MQMIGEPSTEVLLRHVGLRIIRLDCVCVCPFKALALFVCSVMTVTSSLQADALHQRETAEGILGRAGNSSWEQQQQQQQHHRQRWNITIVQVSAWLQTGETGQNFDVDVCSSQA